jgi:glycosyltransferase involved in cell wall biosynthesis
MSLKRITIVSARVGAGHDGAATELARRMRARGFDVDRHDFLDLLPGRLGQRLCDTYHRQLDVAPRSWDWLLGAMGSRGLSHAAIRLSKLATPRLRAALDQPNDLLISTYPLASHALAHLRSSGLISAPLVVYLTDPSVHRLCVCTRADLHIAPNEHAAVHTRRLGARRVEVAAPVVAPDFRPAADEYEKARARASFGLPRHGRFALILSGSWGVGQVEQTTRDVAASGAIKPVVVCGRNDDLRHRLVRAGIAHVYGWVDEMAKLMRACDLVVQNAGGLTTMEALAAGVPVITYRCLPGHGRANAHVLDEAGTVPWIREPGALATALARTGSTTAAPVTHDPAALLEQLARPAAASVRVPAA